MKAIVIAGAHSGIGKTLQAERLLRVLPGWSGLKVTTSSKKRCPRGTSDCGVCAGLKRDFEIIEDEQIIEQAGTDTARLKRAGAAKVIWLKSTSKGLRRGLKKALARLKGTAGVVIEGTSVLKYIKPDLLIFLRGRSKRMRRGAKRAFLAADVIL